MTDINKIIEMDKKHFIHPSSNPKESAEAGKRLFFQKGKAYM